jgi:DNA-binding MarR family transcriptional regulator
MSNSTLLKKANLLALIDANVRTVTGALAIQSLLHGPMKMSELSEKCGCSTQTMHEARGQLEKLGLVSFRNNPDDLRVVFVELTDKGRELAAKVFQ